MKELGDLTNGEAMDFVCMMLGVCNKNIESMNSDLKRTVVYCDLLNRAGEIYKSQDFSLEDKKYVFLKMREYEKLSNDVDVKDTEANKVRENIIDYIFKLRD